MKKSSGLVTVITLLVIAVARSLGDAPVPLVPDDELAKAGMTRYWQAALPLRSGDRVERALRADSELFVMTDFSDLYALKAEVGLLRWTANVTEADFTVFPPTLDVARGGATKVVVTSTDATQFFDRFSGAVVRRFAPPFPPGSSSLSVGDFLFTGSANGRLYAYLFQGGSAAPFKVWEVATGGPITAAPVIVGEDRLVFASQDGSIYACHAADKTFLWSYHTGGPILGDIAVDAIGAYVASSDRSIYKLDLANGRVLWRARLSRPLTDGPVVLGDTVYQFSTREGLIALATDTGQEKWRRPSARKFVTTANNWDVLFTEDRRLEIVDHGIGELVTAIDVRGALDAVTNTADDALYLIASDGRVLCARMSDVPYLRRQQVQAARNQLNLPPIKADENASDDSSATKPAQTQKTDPLRSWRDQKP